MRSVGRLYFVRWWWAWKAEAIYDFSGVKRKKNCRRARVVSGIFSRSGATMKITDSWPSPSSPTKTELNGFFKARRWDARRREQERKGQFQVFLWRQILFNIAIKRSFWAKQKFGQNPARIFLLITVMSPEWNDGKIWRILSSAAEPLNLLLLEPFFDNAFSRLIPNTLGNLRLWNIG